MAVLDFGRTIADMRKHLVGGIMNTNAASYTLPAHKFLHGFFMNYQPIAVAAVGALDGLDVWDFASDPNKPVEGDVFSFRFTRYCVTNSPNGGAQRALQWLVQFVDSAGKTVGGVRQTNSTDNNQADAKGWELVAIGSTNDIKTIDLQYCANRYGFTDYVISCEVTATQTIVTFATAGNTDSIAGNPATVRYAATATHGGTSLPVSKMKTFPVRYNGDGHNGGHYGSDHSAWMGSIVAVNEDLLRLFYSNKPTFTTTGGELTALTLTGSVGQKVGAFSAITAAAHDLRRTFLMDAAPSDTFPTTGYSVTNLRLIVSFGLSQSAKAALAGSTRLETFIRSGGVNYSLGQFGRDIGSAVVEVNSNPATGLPFLSPSVLQFGVVLREEI